MKVVVELGMEKWAAQVEEAGGVSRIVFELK